MRRVIEERSRAEKHKGGPTHLVRILRDLNKRHKARETVLLCALSLDVEPLASADAADHLGDRVAAARAVDGKPRRGLRRRAGTAERRQCARGAPAVALAVKVGDATSRVSKVLLGLELAERPELGLKSTATQHPHADVVAARRDGRGAHRAVEKSLFAEELALGVLFHLRQGAET